MTKEMSSTNLKAISLRFPEHIHRWLKELAAKEKRSINNQAMLMFEQLYEQEREKKYTTFTGHPATVTTTEPPS